MLATAFAYAYVQTLMEAKPQPVKKKSGCPFKTVSGGCRARAFYESGSYLDEEPYCAFEASPT